MNAYIESIVLPAWKRGCRCTCMCTMSGMGQRWHSHSMVHATSTCTLYVHVCVTNSCRSKVIDFHVTGDSITFWRKSCCKKFSFRSLLDLSREDSNQQWHLRPLHVHGDIQILYLGTVSLHVCHGFVLQWITPIRTKRGAGAGMDVVVQVSHFDGYNERWPQSSRLIDEWVIALTLISGLKKLLISVLHQSIDLSVC